MDAEIDNGMMTEKGEYATRGGQGLAANSHPSGAFQFDMHAKKRLYARSSGNGATGESLHSNSPDSNKEALKRAWADDLKRMYDEVLIEKIPEEMVAFLRKLKDAEARES